MVQFFNWDMVGGDGWNSGSLDERLLYPVRDSIESRLDFRGRRSDSRISRDYYRQVLDDGSIVYRPNSSRYGVV